MTGNAWLIHRSSSPSGLLLSLLAVVGSGLVGPWTPIAAAQGPGPDRKEKAVLDIVVLQRRNGTLVLSDTIQLTGVFSSVGTVEYAKGYLRQIHTCADESDGLWSGLEYNWMAVFKLLEPQEEHPSPFCAHPYDKAKLAISKGAKAVIVDVRDNEAAARQLRRSRSTLSQPVIIVRGKDAGHLRRILLWEAEAVGHIKTATDDHEVTVFNEQSSVKDYYNMAIFLGVLIVFSIMSILVILQLRRKWRPREESVTEKTKRVLKKIGTKRYHPVVDMWREQSSDACAICLEEYTGGQELRVLPCSHEFHKECIDPWLLNSPTCPLCLYNIIECLAASKASSTCTSADPIEQYDPTSAYNMEMAPFGARFSVRPRASFAQRTSFPRQMHCPGTDGPPQLYENPHHVNEVFEGLLQTHETDQRSRPEFARRNLSSFQELRYKTKTVPSCRQPLRLHQRTRNRKHVKSRTKHCSHQVPCFISTLSNKFGVCTGEDSSPNRILPFSRGGELSYTNNEESVYSCRARPFYSFSGQNEADMSNLSADDERSQFCQNYSPDGSTTSRSMRGSDINFSDIRSFSSQTTDWSFETKLVPPLSTSFRNSSPPSALKNTHLVHYSTDFTAFNPAHCQTLSVPKHQSSDSMSCESLDSLPLPSNDANLCKLHYCNKRKGVASLPRIEVLCHSPGFHKRSFSSTHCLTQVGIINNVSNIADCNSSVSYLWPSNILSEDDQLSDLSESTHAGLDCLCDPMVQTQSFAKSNLKPFWDISSECSLQLSMLSLCDSQGSFSMQ